MAHFRGTVTGNRGQASRLGHKNTGLVVTANGWHQGVRVVATWNEEMQQDIHCIYVNGGSACGGCEHLIGRIVGGEFRPEVMTNQRI